MILINWGRCTGGDVLLIIFEQRVIPVVESIFLLAVFQIIPSMVHFVVLMHKLTFSTHTIMMVMRNHTGNRYNYYPNGLIHD